MKTIIMPCKCQHEYQDSKYGTNNRVYNIKIKGDSARCTVCLNEKFVKAKG